MSDQRKNLISSTSQELEQHDNNIDKRQKITFYLTIEQINKLDDLAYEHRKIRGRRIKRTDIIRHLIDQCTIETLEGL